MKKSEDLDAPLAPLKPEDITIRSCICLWSAVLHKHLADAGYDGEMFKGGKTAKLRNQYRYQYELKIQDREDARDWLKSEAAEVVAEMAEFNPGYVRRHIKKIESEGWCKPLKRPMITSK
jgi:hypothetical protein